MEAEHCIEHTRNFQSRRWSGYNVKVEKFNHKITLFYSIQANMFTLVPHAMHSTSYMYVHTTIYIYIEPAYGIRLTSNAFSLLTS